VSYSLSLAVNVRDDKNWPIVNKCVCFTLEDFCGRNNPNARSAVVNRETSGYRAPNFVDLNVIDCKYSNAVLYLHHTLHPPYGR
jgi:hypothetical protein